MPTIGAPFQHAARKEKDDRHGDHIADDGNDVHLPQRQAQPDPDGDRAAQLDQRHHGHQKDIQITFQHTKPLVGKNQRVSYSIAYRRAFGNRAAALCADFTLAIPRRAAYNSRQRKRRCGDVYRDKRCKK